MSAALVLASSCGMQKLVRSSFFSVLDLGVEVIWLCMFGDRGCRDASGKPALNLLEDKVHVAKFTPDLVLSTTAAMLQSSNVSTFTL